MKTITKEQIKKINEIHENTIDPNYNPSDPFLVLSDQAYPYLISTGNWSDFKNLLDQFYYGSEDDKVTLYEVLGVNDFEDIKKMSPKNIIDKIGKYDYEEGGDFLEFWGANTSDEIYKLIKNEVDDEYLTKDDLNQIHDIIFNYSKKMKEDSKQKDEDKTLDLLLENFEWFEDYDPASEFIWFNEEDGLGSVSLSFLKQFLLDNSDYPYLDKEGKKIREIVKNNKIKENIPTIEKFLSNLNGGVQGNAILVPNTPEGRKDLYNRLMEDFDHDEEFEKRTAEELNYRTNNAKGYDSRQKEICDSFSKRYNK